MRTIATIVAGTALGLALATAAGAQTVLKASHQFPGGKGDARDEMVQIIAREVKAANVGLEIPGLSRCLAVQAQRPVERDGGRPARHVVVPARLRLRQGGGLLGDVDCPAWCATTIAPKGSTARPS